MAIVTTSNLPPAIQASFNMKLLAVPTPNFIHKIPADKYTKPRNSGDVIRFRRYSRLNPALVPLGNTGVTPPGQTLDVVDRLYVHIKSSLIDLEALWGDKAQASFGFAA